jgi:quercetin dioxygenase-like cupin family protein
MRSSWVSGMVLAGVFAGGVAVGALQQQAATGTRREPQFENEHVRVWKSIIVPNQPLSLHRHDHGRTIIALKGGSLDIVDGNSKTLKTMQWETGKAYWLGVDPAGQQHGDLNRGAEPIEVIVVELKNDVSK